MANLPSHPNPPLAREFFVSQSIYDDEQQRIFRRSWLPVERHETLAAGSLLTLQLTAEPLLVIRAADGITRCFHNVCRHRGALLVDARTPSRLTGDCVTCPYHAWRYNAEGRLVHAPHRPSNGDDEAGLDLVAVASQIWNGYLMAHLDPEPAGEIAYPAIQELLQPWHLERLQSAARLEYRVAANWKLLFQNYSECYHCPSVHPRLNRLSSYRSATNDLTEGPCLGGPMQLADGVASMTTDGHAIGPLLPGLTATQQRQVSYYTLFPAMFISPHPDYVMVHRLYPEGVRETRIVCEFLVADEVASEIERAVAFWDQVNREDWHVCERVQAGAQSRAFRTLHYTPLETTVAAFDRYYLEVMAGV